ncbi:MAG TPA: YCF48-related protein [Polyangia bacterium]|jgi:hypothetical protein
MAAALAGCGGGGDCPALSIDMQSLAAQASAVDVDVYDASASCDGNDLAGGAPAPVVSRHIEGNSGTTLELPAGNYVVVLHAFDASGAFIGSACQADVFTPGQHACVSVALSTPAIDDRGFGDLGTGGGGGGGSGGGGGAVDMAATPFVAQTSGVTTVLYQPWAAGNGIVYIAGASGTILKTTDSGTTWTKQSTGTTYDLEAVWGVSDQNVWAVGLHGTVLHTTNGGSAWSSIGSGTNDLYDVWGTSASDIYVVGAKGAMHSSTGTSFASMAQPAGAVSIGCVWGSGVGDVYLFGGNGLVEHGSSSAGFVKETIGTTDYLNYGWGTANDAWVPSMNSNQTSSSLWHSADHGATWTSQLTTASQLWAVWSTPAGDAILVGTTIQESTDHGATWATVGMPAQILQGVGGDAATGEVWAAGFNGLIMYRP